MRSAHAIAASIRRAGLRATLRRGLWSESTTFGLACDLGALPARQPAAIALRMERVAAAAGADQVFAAELQRLESDESGEVAQRARLCAAGVEGLHVAFADDGRPIYAQWLITAAEQDGMHAALPDLYPHLGEREVLLEGAYTFVDFRRLGAMGDGMHQLLELGRDGGAARALTYVTAEYAPSIKGCVGVGFQLDHLRLDQRRLGRRLTRFRDLDTAECDAWVERTTALKPRPV